jgi:glycosyltransferase involved in cell wall biosynthesis
MDKGLEIEVSICCAFYNRSEYVKESIESLLSQTHKNFEVIVINDGSTDPETKNILDEFDNNNLKVIHQKNSGFVASIKNAISLAKGKYIAIHGAGDISYPERIEKQAQFLNRNKNSGAVSCYFENTVFGGINHGVTKIRRPAKLNLNSIDFTQKTNPFSHGEVMFRVEIYHQVGGYRDFFKFSQDRDLWLRMSEVCQMSIIPTVLYQRREFTSDGVSTNRRKLILQKYLSDFALQCFEDRKHNNKDLLDQYGPAGVFLRRKSKLTAKYFALQSVECLHQNKLNEANRVIELALNEKLTVLGLLITIVIKLSNIKACRIVFQKLIKLHPRSNSWNRT